MSNVHVPTFINDQFKIIYFDNNNNNHLKVGPTINIREQGHFHPNMQMQMHEWLGLL